MRMPPVDKWLAIASLAAAVAGFPLLVISDPLAIFNGFFTIFSGDHSLTGLLYLAALPVLLLTSFFLPGIWCRKLCPLGGLQSILYELRSLITGLLNTGKPETVSPNIRRRYFVTAGTGLLAGALIPKLLRPGRRKVIRPPAAIGPVLYNTLCCRCGNCAKACPTGIIVPNTDLNSGLEWMTPEIIFEEGYCLETCNICSRVCPTGAITLFSVEAKRRIFMGSAIITLDDCLLLHNKECVRCRESCKYDAVKFESEKNILNVVPVIVPSVCVGCGACKVICPANCIDIVPYQQN